MKRVSDNVAPAHMPLDERACAFQRTIVFMRQAYPNMALMTYDSDVHRGAEHLILTKFVVGVGKDNPVWLTYDACDDRTTCDNVPGGLLSNTYTQDGNHIRIGIYPLLIGRNTTDVEGAAVITLESETDTDFWLKFGNGNFSFMHYSPNKDIKGEEIDCEQGNAEINDGIVYITRKDRKEITCVKGNFEYRREIKGEGSYIVAKGNKKECKLIVSFSRSRERATELSNLDPDKELNKVKDYYNDILENIYIKTPSEVLNEAFSHSILNVEYSYLYPYGWIESIQHWPTMWHMEHTATEEWFGRPERTKETLRSQMKNIFESGAIPDMCTTGKGRRDWGGNNQFFLREVLHYLKMTGDLDFAYEVEPYLDRVIKQTFAEYDPTEEGVLAWGTQIGNQEDFESTPGKGAATGSEGAEMLRIMSVIKSLLGKENEAISYRQLSRYSVNKLKKKLWLTDVGRLAWYEDIVGHKYLETAYHGIAYPIIYNQLDDVDMVTSIDHLEHRLSGPEGEVYQSNHFGDHAYDFVPTWGMQCGSDMQPFATAAYSELGMADSAIRPLEFIAKRVCGDYQRGSWPETANEKRFAYFSPSAAVFAQGIIESIFGLNMNLLDNKTVISPCMPTDWTNSEINLPDVHLRYMRKGNSLKYSVCINNDTEKIFKLRLKPFKNLKVAVNGSEVNAGIKARCGFFEAVFSAGTEKSIDVEIEYEDISFELDCPPNIAVGERLDLKVSDVEIVGVDDRCGLFRDITLDKNGLSGLLKSDLLDDYEKFGWFGLLNFARRIFVLKLKLEDIIFEYPVKLVLMPAICFESVHKSGMLDITVHNNTNASISCDAILAICDGSFIGKCNVLSRSKSNILFDISNLQDKLSLGKNKGKLILGEYSYDIEFDVEKNAEIIPIEFDNSLIKPASYWKEIGLFPSHGHMMQGPANFMNGLFEENESIEVFKGVPFK